MIPGPDIFYKCPKCGAYLYTHSLISGNTIGAKIYSDGKMEAPMLPEFPDLTKCERCETIIMLSRIESIRNIKTTPRVREKEKIWERFWRKSSRTKRDICEQQINDASSIKDAYECKHLGISDLRKALAVFPENELSIRLRIWRRYNDIFRMFIGQDSGDSDYVNDILDSEGYRSNCYSLLKLLSEDNKEENLLMAEIKRNLGDFTGCLNFIPKDVLNLITSANRNGIFCYSIDEILTLECEKRNRRTARIDNYYKILETKVKQEAERKEQERVNEEMKDPRWKVCPNGHCFENIRTECNWCGEKRIAERLDKNVNIQHKELFVGKSKSHYILTTDPNIPMQEERIRKITVDHYQDKFIYFHLDGKNPNPFYFNKIKLNQGYINGRSITKICEDIVAGRIDTVDLSSYIQND